MRISAGIMVPNPTFSIVDSNTNGSSLWSMDGIVQTTLQSVAGPFGRRAQRIIRTATGTREYTSGYGTRAYPVGGATTSVYAMVHWKSADAAGGDSWTLKLVEYDIDGAELTEDTLLTESGASASSDWELSTGSTSVNFSLNEPVFLGLRFDFVGAATWDLAFAGIGIELDGSSPGYYSTTANPIHVPGSGSYGMPLSDSPRQMTARGQSIAMDGDRLGNPEQLMVAFETVSEAERTVFRRYWGANHSGVWVPYANTVPGVQGGEYPILVQHELGDSTIPPAMYADWQGEFGFAPWALDWDGTDRYYDGTIQFRERIYR